MDLNRWPSSSIVLGLSIAAAGLLAGNGFARGRSTDRYVEVLSSGGMGYGSSGPTYLFTRLNDLKPAMIREATASAREAAAQFAADSRSRLGGIRQANQGVFVILPRDQAQGVSEGAQPNKTVRVVTTVQYYLKG